LDTLRAYDEQTPEPPSAPRCRVDAIVLLDLLAFGGPQRRRRGTSGFWRQGSGCALLLTRCLLGFRSFVLRSTPAPSSLLPKGSGDASTVVARRRGPGLLPPWSLLGSGCVPKPAHTTSVTDSVQVTPSYVSKARLYVSVVCRSIACVGVKFCHSCRPLMRWGGSPNPGS
jgi:hypothetical protein